MSLHADQDEDPMNMDEQHPDPMNVHGRPHKKGGPKMHEPKSIDPMEAHHDPMKMGKKHEGMPGEGAHDYGEYPDDQHPDQHPDDPMKIGEQHPDTEHGVEDESDLEQPKMPGDHTADEGMLDSPGGEDEAETGLEPDSILDDLLATQSAFALELAEVAHNSEIGGCTIRHYNAAETMGGGAWSPHCLDMLESHEPAEELDDEGNPVQPSAEEIEEREAEKGKIYLESYLEDMKESLGYHFEELDHLDQ